MSSKQKNNNYKTKLTTSAGHYLQIGYLTESN